MNLIKRINHYKFIGIKWKRGMEHIGRFSAMNIVENDINRKV